MPFRRLVLAALALALATCRGGVRNQVRTGTAPEPVATARDSRPGTGAELGHEPAATSPSSIARPQPLRVEYFEISDG